MGGVCAKKQDEPEVQRKSFNYQRINTNIHDGQSQKINQIKQFLTLSTQNTSFINHNTNIQQRRTQSRMTPINITDFKVIRGLGKGAFGQVIMVKSVVEGRFYAMKIIKKQSITNEEERVSTVSQRLILEAMDHPFIVRLHYAFQSSTKLYLLCDLMSGGELFYLLRRSKKFPQQIAKFYAAQILLALQYLHSRNIIYRDLKPQNILLDQEGHIKLTDFGLSKVCISQKQLAYSICGTPQYIAPEVMLGKGYTQTADWFSFGSLLYDMLTGKPPFYSSNKNDILRNITTRPVPIPEDLSPDAKSLLKGLFKIKPKQRLGWANGSADIKKHPFFANVDFEMVMNKKVQAPISFREAINEQGFDVDFHHDSHESTINLDRTMKQKGLIFDGFTYYKPQLSPRKGISLEESNQSRQRQMQHNAFQESS